ncbi:hypothetical protein HAX54_048227 [Datura stramonium]|uniref:Uncharacterized protein n=1 Tax=Datura stramonium TaxID=4076 RepID=A0ABS8SUA7_DATST|nr:hypothetical protein [Datura stramonium]
MGKWGGRRGGVRLVGSFSGRQVVAGVVMKRRAVVVLLGEGEKKLAGVWGCLGGPDWATDGDIGRENEGGHGSDEREEKEEGVAARRLHVVAMDKIARSEYFPANDGGSNRSWPLLVRKLCRRPTVKKKRGIWLGLLLDFYGEYGCLSVGEFCWR